MNDAPARTLIIGYGNPDREDDGAAWHVLSGLARRLGRPVPTLAEGFTPTGQQPDCLFALQLTPEMAELFIGYAQVVFVDAHTGAASPEDVQAQRVQAQFQSSPLTHHLTPESCLEIAAAVYYTTPEAWLVSVRGDYFGFSNTLSPTAAARIDPAVEAIVRIMG